MKVDDIGGVNRKNIIDEIMANLTEAHRK